MSLKKVKRNEKNIKLSLVSIRPGQANMRQGEQKKTSQAAKISTSLFWKDSLLRTGKSYIIHK